MSSSTFGYAVYAAIVVLAVAWSVFTYVNRPRYATLEGVAARMMRHPVVRWAVWALWAFIGWHLFVRGSGAFE
jgi:hypothetical protein